MKTKFLFLLAFTLVPLPTVSADIITSFDTAEGFTVGSIIGGQNGWTQFAASTTQPIISSDNPLTGDGHLRIGDDTTIADGTAVGAFSPTDVAVANQSSITTVDMFIDDDGGADYRIQGQSPTEGLATFIINFGFQGDIVVADDTGGGPAFVDTGATWDQTTYTEVVIDFDTVAGTIDYSYNGSLIYTGNIWAGTRVEEVILRGDNFQGVAGNAPNAFADFDNFSLIQGAVAIPEPGSLCLISLAGLSVLVSRKRRA
jgi:hypothetical protein